MTDCSEHVHPLRITIAMSLALLVGGCHADRPTGGAPGQAGAGGKGTDIGGGGGVGGGQGTAGADGQNPDPLACGNRTATMSWSLTPTVAQLSGTVLGKAIGMAIGNAVRTGGSETFEIVDAGGVQYNLTLGISLSAPIATGDRIDIRTAELSVFRIYRSLEIRKDGDPIVYVTEVEQPNLPPPLRLDVGEQSCTSNLFPVPTSYHRLVAYDGDQAITIDVGQQADVGRFRVLNDLIYRFPSTVTVEDAINTFRVALVRAR